LADAILEGVHAGVVTRAAVFIERIGAVVEEALIGVSVTVIVYLVTDLIDGGGRAAIREACARALPRPRAKLAPTGCAGAIVDRPIIAGA